MQILIGTVQNVFLFYNYFFTYHFNLNEYSLLDTYLCFKVIAIYNKM